MKRLKLVSNYGIPKKSYIVHETRSEALPNLINGEFNDHKANEVVVGDVTYLRLFGKWYYLCTLLDLCGRFVIGYSFDKHRNAELVQKSFHSIKGNLGNIGIFHYDLGSEANNKLIDNLVSAFGIKRSYSARGNPYDNAVIESWHNSFKREFFKRSKFIDLQDFTVKLADHIHWYNNVRVHSSLNYMTPNEWRNNVV